MGGPWPRTSSNSDGVDVVTDHLASLIRRRRMTRTFSGGPDPDQLIAWCDLARHAPSAGYSQGSHLLVLDGPERSTFFEVSGAAEWFARTSPGVLDCTQIVLVLGDPQAYVNRYSEADKAGHGLDDESAWACPFWLTDAAMVAQNLLLILENHSVGALFFGLYADPRATLSRFGVPERVRCIGAIAVGHRAETDAPSGSAVTRDRVPRDQVVHRGHW